MNLINEEIKSCIETGRWNTFGKIGGVEATHVANYLITKQPKLFGSSLHINAGIYTKDENDLKKWFNTFIDSIKDLDYVLEWCPEQGDKFILDNIWRGKKRFHSFQDLEPFSHLEEGWHYSFEDKKILVLSPFEKTIYKQVENYSNIWEGAKIGDVEVIKMPFSSAITKEKNPTKFIETYEDLNNKIKKTDFDFAIVGAGGFSLPLLKTIKSLKKPGIHMGGATQIIFGISGSRWDNDPSFCKSKWYNKNKFWSKPLTEEIPINSNLIENGCYW